jgi:hypothetical protein
MKRIVALIVLIVAGLIAYSQSADTSYRLFWFKGKKIKQNELLTPLGDTVFYNASKGTIKKASRSGTGKQLDKMLAETGKTELRINEMIQKISSLVSPPAVPFYAKPLKDAFEEIDENFEDALSTTIEIPNTLNGTSNPGSAVRGPLNFQEDASDEETEKAIADILAYMQQHKDDPIGNLPVPPAKDLRYCSRCDKNVDDMYRNACREFEKEFYGEEKDIALEILRLERKTQLEAEKIPAAAGSEEYAESVRERLDNVRNFLMVRTLRKANKLIELYKNDPFRCQEVCLVALSLERQRELLGDGVSETITYPDGFKIQVDKSDKEAINMDAINGMIGTLFKMIEKAMIEYDYSLALNPVLILGVERQRELLGTGESNYSEDIVSKYVKFNRFKLSIHISGKLSGSGFYQTAELKGDNYFGALPDPNDTISCGLKWVLLGPDPAEKVMKFDLVDAKMLGNGGELIYAGTKSWKSNQPKIKINFCGNGNDTIEVFSFQPYIGKETWIVPKYGSMDMLVMSNVLLGCFMDVNRARQDANSVNAEKMKQQMMEAYQKFQKNYSASSAPSASQISSMMNMAKAVSDGSKVSEIAQNNSIGSYLIKPVIQNKNKIVFKERLNGKELFPQNTSTEYAWLDISFEEDPKK